MRKFVLSILVTLAASVPALAHCDSVEGPVVKAAKQALSSGNVNLVLAWVQPGDEDIVRDAFARAAKVRRLNADAASLADT
jgi:hypothetical protein